MKTLIFALLALTAQAHEGHSHEPALEAAPHGGILRDAPPYKTELTLQGADAKIYLYDKTLKPVPAARLKPEAKGRLGLPKDKTKREVVFKLTGDRYEAKLPGIEKVHRFDLHVNMTVDGKDILGDFGVDNIR